MATTVKAEAMAEAMSVKAEAMVMSDVKRADTVDKEAVRNTAVVEAVKKEDTAVAMTVNLGATEVEVIKKQDMVDEADVKNMTSVLMEGQDMVDPVAATSIQSDATRAVAMAETSEGTTTTAQAEATQEVARADTEETRGDMRPLATVIVPAVDRADPQDMAATPMKSSVAQKLNATTANPVADQAMAETNVDTSPVEAMEEETIHQEDLVEATPATAATQAPTAANTPQEHPTAAATAAQTSSPAQLSTLNPAPAVQATRTSSAWRLAY